VSGAATTALLRISHALESSAKFPRTMKILACLYSSSRSYTICCPRSWTL